MPDNECTDCRQMFVISKAWEMFKASGKNYHEPGGRAYYQECLNMAYREWNKGS